ncbi:uncharacterized protein LOC144210939 isoform X1 [Stigmatopora nigra]
MEPTNTRAALCEDICHLSPHSRGGHKPTPGQVCTSLPSRTKPRNGRPHAGTLVAAPLRIARSSRSLRRPSERTVHAGVDGGLCRMANPQIRKSKGRQHHNFGHVTFMSFMASSRQAAGEVGTDERRPRLRHARFETVSPL